LAQALVEFQYPTEASNGRLKKGDKSDGIRMLAKKLQRAHANIVYELLDREKCDRLIRRLAVGLALTAGGTFTDTGAD
jgi:hypothetical protein